MQTPIDNTSSDSFFLECQDYDTQLRNSSPRYADYTGFKQHKYGNIGSSEHDDINKVNRETFEYLNSKTEYFINLTHHVDFEDGCYNEASDYVQQALELNESVTCNWLNRMLDLYRFDSVLVSSILYIIGLLEIDDLYLSSLMNIVDGAFKSGDCEQEMAALKVMENLRTESCYRILCSVTLQHDWIADYAKKVKDELAKELNINAA